MGNKERISTNIEIQQSGEIRFGPPLFSLWLNGRKIENRTFFREFCLSNEEKILAIAEYIYLNQATYVTQILIFDFKKSQATYFNRVKNETVRPIRFEGRRLIFSYQGLPGIIKEAEINVNDLTIWVAFVNL